MINDTLFVVPARGGSKGVPGKNIRPLNGKPLIYYTIDAARELTEDENICVSTDSLEIKNVVEAYGLQVPFIRPYELATDHAGTYEVLLHALNFYRKRGREYKRLVLLQPTSPFRNGIHVSEALKLYSNDLDMVVSVRESASNPYYTLFEESKDGFLFKSKEGNFARRQDCPKIYEFNGAIYVINVNSLIKNPLSSFTRVKRYEMPEINSIDIDSPIDFAWTEFILTNNLI